MLKNMKIGAKLFVLLGFLSLLLIAIGVQKLNEAAENLKAIA